MHTATGKSLSLYRDPILEINLYPENTKGLPEIYNLAIEKFKNEPSILIFAHDDLHILDFYWIHSIINGLTHFGIVGVVGAIKRFPQQPAWCFEDNKFIIGNSQNLSGIIGHGAGFPLNHLSSYGPPFQECKLLDGVLLAVLSETLIKYNLRFDERFKFHFYDMDFCRQAEILDVSMGTVPISLAHESQGNFCSDSWWQSHSVYFNKWEN